MATGPSMATIRQAPGILRSPQINTANVSHLQRAWTYHTGEQGRSFEATPIFVDNVLYLSTQNQNIVALNPETGKEIWKYTNPTPRSESRGVAYWPGDRQTPPRILFGTGDGRLIELDAKTGTPVAAFGDNGAVNLRAGITDKFPKAPLRHQLTASHLSRCRDRGPIHAGVRQRRPERRSAGFRCAHRQTSVDLSHRAAAGEPGNETWGPEDGRSRRS